jgi:hypothetical protein
MTPPTKLTLRTSEILAFVSFIAAVHLPELSFVILASSWILLYLGVLLKNF